MARDDDRSSDRTDVQNPKNVKVKKLPDGTARGVDETITAGPDKASTGPKGQAGMGLGVSRGDYTQAQVDEDRRWPEAPSGNRSD